ncbi:MAG: methionyl-tRNA formyltransferase [Verrucomicrobiota bacterium]
MNLLFLSSDPISLPSLHALTTGEVPGVVVNGVVTNPDRRKGRGKKLQRNPVAAAAGNLGLPVLQTEKLTHSQLEDFVPFDTALVFAFGQILSQRILSLAPDRFLNLHASPLPLLRGASPIETAIAEGWTETAVCLMQIVHEMDAGPVADRVSIPIAPTDTGLILRAKVAESCPDLLRKIGAELQWEEQDHSAATWCRKLSKADAQIDFSLTSSEVVDHARAFGGWPGASLLLNGEMVKAEDIRAIEGSAAPGTILPSSDTLDVACGDGAVSIGRLQWPTKKMIPFREFRKQYPVGAGDLIEYAKSRPLQRNSQH